MSEMGERLEFERGGEQELLAKVELRGEREGGLVDAMVPVELIDDTEVAVDENHVRELLESMNIESEKGIISGQLTPVLLAHVADRPKLSIIDGFHRNSALKLAGSDQVFATIRLNTSESEVEDLRILTANSHSSVSFARINEWVSEAWEKTAWAQKITSAQAFNLANNKKLTGAKLGLDNDEAEAIRAWAIDKCNRWRMSASTITQTMATALVADPELVNSARGRESGHELKTLTPQHLKEVARVFPNEYGLQRAVAEVAITHNLTVQQLKQVLEILSTMNDAGDIETVIINKDWAALFDGQSRNRGRKTNEEKARTGHVEKSNRTRKGESSEVSQGVGSESRSVILQYAAARIAMARLQLENSVLRGVYVAPPAYAQSGLSFSLDLSKYPKLEQAAQPSIDLSIEDAFVNRFETQTPKLMDTFIKHTQASEAEATTAIKEIGRRISLDLQRGALRFVDITRGYILDELMRACLVDEIHETLRGRTATISPIDSTVTTFDGDLGIELLPQLAERAQTPLILSGVFSLGAHSIAQVIQLDRPATTELIRSTHERLSAADRIKKSHSKGERNERARENTQAVTV